MNKKNIFLGLAVLFCASQVSAGWRDSLATGVDWVKSGISWIYSGVRAGISSLFSLSTRACVALRVCAAHALNKTLISMTEAKREIGQAISNLHARKPLWEFEDFEKQIATSNASDLEARANGWSQDDLLAAYNYFGLHGQGAAQANLVLKVWAARFLNKQVGQ